MVHITEGLGCSFYCSACFHVSYCAVKSAAGEKDKRRDEMFMSQRQSSSRVLWPDFSKLARRGREEERRRGCSRMWRHHHSGTDRNPAQTHSHLLHAATEISDGGASESSTTHKQISPRESPDWPYFLVPLLVLSETGGHGVLPSSSPLGSSLETNMGIRSVCELDARKNISA